MRIIIKLWLAIRLWWSKLYWSKKDIVYTCQLAEEDLFGFNSFDELSQKIKATAVRVRSRFEYTQDGADQLFDSICPPAECYRQYSENTLRDDCDGFHACLYHILSGNNIDCVLCTAVPLKSMLENAHTFIAYREDTKWRVVDYTSIDTEKYDSPLLATQGHYARYGESIIELNVWDDENRKYVKY